MMKAMTFAIMLCVGLNSFAKAQITITNTSFPKLGDTLRTCSDASPSNKYKISDAGTNQDWDFSNLKQSTTTTVAIVDVKSGSKANYFSSATLLETTIPTAGSAITNEAYIKVTNKTYERVGATSSGNTNALLDGAARYVPSSVERRAPLKFLDNNFSKSALSVGFKASALPDSLIKALGALAGSVDSIRIRITYDRSELVDATGKIKIPGGAYDVIREKRTQYSDTRLDIKTGFLGWQDITGLIGTGAAGGLGGQLGKDTTTTFSYYSNAAKEPIAVFTVDKVDNTKITRANFKYNKIVLANEDLDAQNLPDIKAYPNPAIDDISIDFINLNASNYTLKIYNILGSVVAKESFSGAVTKSIRMDITKFRKGTYLYALSDASGKIIISKRLIVIRP